MYNLLDEPWVSVLYRDGTGGRINLSQAMRDAAKLQLAYSNPLDRLAVFRFILALGYWCYANTSLEPSEGHPLPSRWEAWLQENRSFFELFGPDKRFMQVEGLQRIRPISDLIHELPAANNLWHFRHVTDYLDGICPACCVSGLLRLPVFTTIGGRGFGAGINEKPPIYAVWLGQSLAEMLSLNWAPIDNMGIPSWVLPFPYNGEQEIGLLIGMTWLPRKAMLQDPIPGDNKCSACGCESSSLVYACHLENNPAPREATWADPHTIPNDKGDTMRARIALMSSDKFAFTQSDWYRPLATFLAQNPGKLKGNLFLLGFTTQQNKYIDAWELNIDLDGREATPDSLERMSSWQTSLSKARKKIFEDEHKRIGVNPYFVNLMHHAEKQVSSQAGALSDESGYSWQDVTLSYKPLLRVLGQSLAPGVSVNARIARSKISQFMPYPINKKKAKGDSERLT